MLARTQTVLHCQPNGAKSTKVNWKLFTTWFTISSSEIYLWWL